MSTASAVHPVYIPPTSIPVEMIGPGRAGEYLASNTHNRKLRRAKINEYARDMQRGRWRFNGVPIGFDTGGVLIEGQHRMYAVVESNVILPFAVLRGLPPETQETYDRNIWRSGADALNLRGYSNSHQLASIGRRVWEWVEKGPTWNFTSSNDKAAALRSPSQTEILDLIEGDESILEATGYTVTARRYIPCRPSILGLSYWVFNQIDREEGWRFFKDIEGQANLPTFDPVLALLRRFRDEAATGNRHGGRVDEEGQMALFVSAWNARREGRDITRLMIRPDHDFPKPR